jgi:hypothetical protein
MHPDELAQILTSMPVVADVVDALSDSALRAARGWDLTGWSCHFVPWGVRFLRHDAEWAVTAAVVALALPEVRRAQCARTYANAPWPVALLMLG